MSKTFRNEKSETRKIRAKISTNPCDCCLNIDATICAECPYCSETSFDYCCDEDVENEEDE